MILKKTISCFLILVLTLQLLPVRQVINYFFVDNQLTEEIAETSKGATKNIKVVEEDKLMHDLDNVISFAITLKNKAAFHFSESLPAFNTAEIPTPPPNQFLF